ncbi:hypothetical protein HYV79_00370 [Candidatus Woesearchaeota archaeon]|nr:hypothetical protein [Candidatus Woesearchaeota archaeon]
MQKCRFSKNEWKIFIITVFLFAFMFSFNEWGVEKFDLIIGLENYLLALFIVGLSVFVHHSTQRITAILLEYKPEHKIWWRGLIIGLIITIITNGKFWFFAASSFWILIPEKGRFRRPSGPNMKDFAIASLRGPLSNVALAASVKTLSWIIPINELFVQKLFVFNLLYAFFQLLPIPPLDGSRVFFASRQWYVLLVGFFLSYIFLFAVFSIFSFIWAFLIAFIIWFLYYTFVEL